MLYSTFFSDLNLFIISIFLLHDIYLSTEAVYLTENTVPTLVCLRGWTTKGNNNPSHKVQRQPWLCQGFLREGSAVSGSRIQKHLLQRRFDASCAPRPTLPKEAKGRGCSRILHPNTHKGPTLPLFQRSSPRLMVVYTFLSP